MKILLAPDGKMDRQGPSRRVLPSSVIGIVVEHTKVRAMVTMALKDLCSRATLAKLFASRAPCRYLSCAKMENFPVERAREIFPLKLSTLGVEEDFPYSLNGGKAEPPADCRSDSKFFLTPYGGIAGRADLAS